MKVTFLQFAKRQNSTKLPTSEQLAAGIKYEATYLKALTNIDNPVLYIDGVDENIYAYNHCYIEEWGRFYFVVTADLNNEHICKITLELDDLGTFKSSILATSAFVIYSTSEYNRWLKDERIPIVIKDSSIISGQSVIISTADEEPVFDVDVLNETVILSAISKDMGLMHYVIDEDTLQDIAASLCGTDITSFLNDLEQQFGDAVGSIVQIRRIPVNKNVLNYTQLGTIYLGAFEVTDKTSGNPMPATYLNSTLVAATGSISYPVTYTDFRYTEPYCTARLSLPFVGVVDIAISDFPDGSIYWKMLLDVVSGGVIFTLYNSDGDAKPVASFSGECGMLVPIASAQIANAASIVTSAASSGVGLVAGTATGNPAAIVGGILGITQAFTATLQKSMSVIGSYAGNRSEFINDRIRIMVEKYNTALEPSDLAAIEGRPCCKVVSLATLTGYCRTQGFSIELAANKAVIDSINAKMDAGVYLE